MSEPGSSNVRGFGINLETDGSDPPGDIFCFKMMTIISTEYKLPIKHIWVYVHSK